MFKVTESASGQGGIWAQVRMIKKRVYYLLIIVHSFIQQLFTKYLLLFYTVYLGQNVEKCNCHCPQRA